MDFGEESAAAAVSVRLGMIEVGFMPPLAAPVLAGSPVRVFAVFDRAGYPGSLGMGTPDDSGLPVLVICCAAGTVLMIEPKWRIEVDFSDAAALGLLVTGLLSDPWASGGV